MDKQTALLFEILFGGLMVLFLFLWIFLTVIPLFDMGFTDLGDALSFLLLNPYFISSIIFGVIAGIFEQLKKTAAAEIKIHGAPQHQQVVVIREGGSAR